MPTQNLDGELTSSITPEGGRPHVDSTVNPSIFSLRQKDDFFIFDDSLQFNSALGGELTSSITPAGRPAALQSLDGELTSSVTSASIPSQLQVMDGELASSIIPFGAPSGIKNLDGELTSSITPVGLPTFVKALDGELTSSIAPVGLPTATTKMSGRLKSSITPAGRPSYDQTPAEIAIIENSPPWLSFSGLPDKDNIGDAVSSSVVSIDSIYRGLGNESGTVSVTLNPSNNPSLKAYLNSAPINDRFSINKRELDSTVSALFRGRIKGIRWQNGLVEVRVGS